MLVSLGRNRVQITRTTNQPFDSFTTDASFTSVTKSVEATPKSKCTVSFRVRPKGNGSAVITGVIDGVSTTDNVTIPASGIARGDKNFDSISQIEIIGSGLTSRTITTRFVGRDGGSIKARKSLVNCIPAQISFGGQSYIAGVDGSLQRGKVTVLLPDYCDIIPREGDILTDLDTNNAYIVEGNALFQALGLSRHYEVVASRYEEK